MTTRKQVDTERHDVGFFASHAATEGNILAKLQIVDIMPRWVIKMKQNPIRKYCVCADQYYGLHNYGCSINFDDYDEGLSISGRIALQPTSITAQQFGSAVQGQGRRGGKALRSSLALKPENPDTHTYLAIVISSDKNGTRKPSGITAMIRIKPSHHRAILGCRSRQAEWTDPGGRPLFSAGIERILM